MQKKIKIKSRYSYLKNNNGKYEKVWTKWFNMAKGFKTKEDAIAYINELKKFDKKHKFEHEYEICI